MLSTRNRGTEVVRGRCSRLGCFSRLLCWLAAGRSFPRGISTLSLCSPFTGCAAEQPQLQCLEDLLLPSCSSSFSSSSSCFSSSRSSSLFSSHPGVHGSVSHTFSSSLPTAGQRFVLFCPSFTMVSLRRCRLGCRVQLCPVTVLPELAGTGFVQHRAAPAFPQRLSAALRCQHLGTYIWSRCIEMYIFLQLSTSWSRRSGQPI